MSSGEKVLQQPAHLIRLLPEGRFALRMVIFYIASARPVTMVLVVYALAFLMILHIYGVRLATSSGSPPASHLPLKGKALSTAEVRSSFLKKRPQEKIDRQGKIFAPAFPLRGRCRRSRRMRCSKITLP